MTTRVLFVDDDRSLAETIAVGLTRRRYAITACGAASDAIEALSREDFDVVVTDLNMRGTSGIELCGHIVENRPEVPVIVVTAFGSLESAVSAIRAGAYDFISKPVELDVLTIAIDRAARHRSLGSEVKRLRLEAARERRSETFVGDSEAMRGVDDLVQRVASTDASVLVTGESGTGKELVARALHRRSARGDKPFTPINCAAMPETLLESELFGHARGAFTDARTTEPGLFLQSDGGTVFLDEIGDMPLALQPKLLRVLEERTVRAVGGRVETPVDVRIVAATNRDLESAVEEGRFREDLFYRINVVHVALPPLRARGGDVLRLAQHFLAQLAERSGKPTRGFSAPAARRLLSYTWPGNVRELRNCVERAVALSRFDEITVDDLPDKLRDYRSDHVIVAGDDPTELVPLEEVERRYVARVMSAVSGNKTAAARVLGIDRKRLYRILERLGIDAQGR